jgi:spoIIIJ-associated protein
MTGPSVDQAKDSALDELGVDETDAEFEVLEEPKTGLFGRTRGEAKVRARVRPTAPRPKQERRDRRRGGGGGQGGGGNRSSRGGRNRGGGGGGRGRGQGGGGGGGEGGQRDDARGGERSKGAEGGGGEGRGGGSRGASGSKKGSSGRNRQADSNDATAPAGSERNEEKKMTEAMTAPEQGEIVKDFVEGLLDAFGVDGDVDVEVQDEDIVQISASGEDLGLLIGPRGNTLDAVQELARRSLQRQAEDTGDVRVRVDVGGYRERRRVALDRFARDAATKVLDSGERLALEPMSAADRKVVHDAINDVDGVSTVSEGEDHRRRVVLVPDTDD